MLETRVDRCSHLGDGGAATLPRAFAYANAYAAARSCLGALEDNSDFDDFYRYEHLLLALDGTHGGDFPATYPMPGTPPELLAHLEDEIDQMIELDGNGLSLELLLASAQWW